MEIWCAYNQYDGPEDSAYFVSKEKALLRVIDCLGENGPCYLSEIVNFAKTQYTWAKFGDYIIFKIKEES